MSESLFYNMKHAIENVVHNFVTCRHCLQPSWYDQNTLHLIKSLPMSPATILHKYL